MFHETRSQLLRRKDVTIYWIYGLFRVDHDGFVRVDHLFTHVNCSARSGAVDPMLSERY